ncbi:MAG: hypothetical protein LPK45_11750 [Bacteroidota bacterium]|nr:hypothetical protein [Bacteroidota bacterium]MDX5431783.1 hypothetical protein [Bacteroidota bacterium]MDX5470496.1 hypothetical protein [Bacteroidota bacterium]
MKTSIEIKYSQEEKKNRRAGILGSLASIGLILAVLFSLGLYYQIPPPEEEGVALLLGTPDGGMMQEFAELPTSSPSNPSNPNPDESLTQDIEEAPSIQNNPQQTTPVSSNTPETNEPSTRPTRTFSTDGRTGGSGDGGNPGNQGSPDGGNTGSPYGTGGNGTQGNGLGSRNAIQKPIGQSRCEMKGIIMVRIEVDPKGRVVKAEYEPKNSTISNTVCRTEAIAYAKTWRFEPDPTTTNNVVDVLPVQFQ